MIPYAYLVKATVMHELHDDAEAYMHISEVWKICNTVRMYQAEFMTLLLEARIAFDRGDETLGKISSAGPWLLEKSTDMSVGIFG